MQNGQQENKKNYILGIFLSILLPTLAICTFLVLRQANLSFSSQFLISRFAQWTGLILLFVFALKIEKRPFLLWKENEYSGINTLKATGETMLFLIIGMFVVGIIIKLLNANVKSSLLDKTVHILQDNIIFLLFTCITAGIIEELIFRGYMFPRLQILLKSNKLAIIISSFLFGILHYSYGTLLQTLGPMIFGAIQALQYQKYKSIKVVIISHFLWDLVVLLTRK
ncbi:MAG: type II CAAX endopeptidase family protein [Flavobacterium sp.]